MMKTIISLVGLIAAGGAFFMFTQPRYDAVKSANLQIAQYDQALQKAAELQARKQELLSRFNAFNPDDRGRLEKLLPDHVDNVRLILDLDNLASKHALAMQNVVVAGTSGTPAAQTAIGAIGASKQKYDSLTLTFTTEGTYKTFQEFIAELEMSLRIVDLVSLKITYLAVERSTEPTYSYTMTIRTYWLK
ncbi:MAG TPA: type 4a pilus biogenesis protein PilO [Candidatus Paceibacterota bacterium]